LDLRKNGIRIIRKQLKVLTKLAEQTSRLLKDFEILARTKSNCKKLPSKPRSFNQEHEAHRVLQSYN